MLRSELMLCAAAAGAAVCATAPPDAAGRLRSILAPAKMASASKPPSRTLRSRRDNLELGLAAAIPILLASFLGSAAAAVLAGAATALVLMARRRQQRARAEQSNREAVVELCGVMVAELRAGRSPADALSLAAPIEPLISLVGPALTAHALGGDVPGALDTASRRPGAVGLARLAACWTVAGHSGAGLASALDRLGDSLRNDELIRREVNAQVASPRATARLMASLPILAILIAGATGADPLEVLLHSPVGLLCAVVGAALTLTGLWWSERLVNAAERAI